MSWASDLFASLPGDPVFWASAVVAVLLTGVSKGGVGGMALFAVPIMALSISPVTAAAIMLPILVVMDWFAAWTYRRTFDRTVVLRMMPAALLGIGIGWALAGSISEDGVRIAVGLIAVAFPLWQWLGPKDGISGVADSAPAGWLAGMVAGFTSFLAHAGGPPFKAYALPYGQRRGLSPEVFAGSAVMFFFVVNAAKLVPYAALGQFDRANVATSLALIPLAPVGVLIGAWIVRRMDARVFYPLIYTLVFATGVKLLWDGVV